MLPLLARGAAEEIGGAGRRDESLALPAFARLAAEAEARRGEEGEADHVAEDRPVAVPADAGARGIFDEKGMADRLWREPGPSRRAVPNREKPVGQRLRLMKATAVEAVLQAERDGAPFALEAVELEGAERKAREPCHEPRFLRLIEEVGRVSQAFGEVVDRRRREQVELAGRHRPSFSALWANNSATLSVP